MGPAGEAAPPAAALVAENGLWPGEGGAGVGAARWGPPTGQGDEARRCRPRRACRPSAVAPCGRLRPVSREPRELLASLRACPALGSRGDGPRALGACLPPQVASRAASGGVGRASRLPFSAEHLQSNPEVFLPPLRFCSVAVFISPHAFPRLLPALLPFRKVSVVPLVQESVRK